MLFRSSLGTPQLSMLPLLDSALRIFPGDTTLIKTKNAILSGNNNNSNITFYQTYQKAISYFSNREFNKAINEFNKAWDMENQYLCLENIGLCYYSTARYKEAINYFEKVIETGKSNDGKAEFFKGASLISLGKAPEACPFLKIAQKKNYAEAKQFINNYCK